MTSAQEIYEEWTDGETSGVRAARVQTLRSDIMEHTDLFVPRRRAHIEAWTERMKPQITRKLREAAESEAEESDDDDTADEEESESGDESASESAD